MQPDLNARLENTSHENVFEDKVTRTCVSQTYISIKQNNVAIK